MAVHPTTRSRNDDDLPLVAVLTALTVEFAAVKAKLTHTKMTTTPLGGVYTTGRFVAADRTWRVALTAIGAGNPGAAIAAGDAINELEPDMVVFLGIAGGLKDVGWGDVAVASKVYGYERGKATAGGFVPSPEVAPSHSRLVSHFTHVAMANSWRARIPKTARMDPAPSVVVAPIAAGEKVVKSEKSQVAKDIREHFPDAVAVEMEGMGTLAAAAYRGHVPAIVIRGISDLLSDKSPRHDAVWQSRASMNAAAVLFQGLAELDPVWLAGNRERFKAAALAPELAENVFGRSGMMTIDPGTQWSVRSVVVSLDEPPFDGPGKPASDLDLRDWTLIGTGSMNTVYRARRYTAGLDLGWAMIKVAQPGHEDRLRAEVTWSSRVSLPSVRSFLDLRQVQLPDGKWGLAALAQWTDAPSLAERIADGGLLTLGEARDLWRSMARVVEATADQGFVHGDIKPSNIVGEPGAWMLIDFGAAGPVGDSVHVLGTPLYMPPEAFMRARQPSSDIYSLALTVVASLTGVEGDAARVFALQTTTYIGSSPPPPSPAWLGPQAIQGLPSDWTELILACLLDAPERPTPSQLLERVYALGS